MESYLIVYINVVIPFSPEFHMKTRFDLDMENCLQSYEQIISVVETYSIQIPSTCEILALRKLLWNSIHAVCECIVIT